MNKETVLQARRDVLKKLLGPVDSYGFAACPGRHLHTSRNNPRDFRVFGIEGKTPRGSCFHSRCRDLVDSFNDRLATELVLADAHFWPWEEEDPPGNGIGLRRKKTQVNIRAIMEVEKNAAPEITLEWLKAVSPVPPSKVSTHDFLTALYPKPEDRVLIFNEESSQGQFVWSPVVDPSWEQKYIRTSRKGVWFLVQPVTGDYTTISRLRTPYNPTGKTRRSIECVTDFRYMVLESDNVDPETWIKVLVSLPLPIVSVTSSGSRSLHALVRVDAKNQMGWEQYRHDTEAGLVTLGCDPGALKAVQLSRLPGCYRFVKFDKDGQVFVPFTDGPHLQELFYLNPNASGTTTIWDQNKH